MLFLFIAKHSFNFVYSTHSFIPYWAPCATSVFKTRFKGSENKKRLSSFLLKDNKGLTKLLQMLIRMHFL